MNIVSRTAPAQACRFGNNRLRWWLVTCLVCGLPLAARAHVEGHEAEGFVSGFTHPLSGLDHMLAMLAVGLWGAQLGGRAMWMLPVMFPLVMACGGFLGLIGVPLPGIEIGIALSAVILGGLVLAETRPPLWLSAVLVSAFGVFHGHAHGAELPAGGNAALYSVGFVISTGLLHAVGIALGLVHRWPAGKIALRASGAVVCLGGCFFLWNAIA
ncbi:MAG TPA: HupE/UreJ family protein [Verrucomicrobiae bacterium]|nr:HupE/UreJ family protein [Verrucomicrobiae bacterium]